MASMLSLSCARLTSKAKYTLDSFLLLLDVYNIGWLCNSMKLAHILTNLGKRIINLNTAGEFLSACIVHLTEAYKFILLNLMSTDINICTLMLCVVRSGVSEVQGAGYRQHL